MCVYFYNVEGGFHDNKKLQPRFCPLEILLNYGLPSSGQFRCHRWSTWCCNFRRSSEAGNWTAAGRLVEAGNGTSSTLTGNWGSRALTGSWRLRCSTWCWIKSGHQVSVTPTGNGLLSADGGGMGNVGGKSSGLKRETWTRRKPVPK